MTTKTYTVSLDKLIREFNLEKVYLPKLPQEILILPRMSTARDFSWWDTSTFSTTSGFRF